MSNHTGPPCDTLFLHGGPGLSAYVERQVLGARYPQVHFWDQPPIHQVDGAFAILLDAAIAEINRLMEASDRPVKLLAHSFGGHLASALLDRVPDWIGDCHLVSTCWDLPGGFRNLLAVMERSGTTADDLRERIGALLSSDRGIPPDRQRIWDYINLVVSDARFIRHYWPSLDQYDTYTALAETGPALDSSTFKNVLNDFLADHSGARDGFSGPQSVVIELGGNDPLLVLEEEQRAWATRFPSGQVLIKPAAGHFIHLEPWL